MLPTRTQVAGLLAVLLVFSAGPAGAITAGTGLEAGSERVSVEETPVLAQETDGSLSKSTYRVVRGETVEITFSHSGPATLAIGGEGAGYLLQVDVSGSGTSTVAIDTYASTGSNPDSYVEGGDATLVYPEGGLERSLVPTSYNLNLTVGGIVQDLGLLVIEERPSATMTPAIAPGDLDLGETDHAGLRSAMTERQTVAKGDYAILDINATGLGNAIDPEQLAGGSAAAGIEVYFEDLEAEPNQDPRSFSASDPDVETYWDEETSNLLVVWDTSDVRLSGGNHAYNVTLRIEAEHNDLITEDSLESSAKVTVVEPRIELQTAAGQLEVYPWESDIVELRGTTNYAPGSTFEFRAQAFEPRPFLKKSDATVGENGTIASEMDLGDVARGIEFPLWVLDHREVNGWEISLRSADASFDFANQTAEEGEAARFGNVSLSVGGFLVLAHPNGTMMGVSQPIGEATDSRVNVFFDTPLNRSAYVTGTAVMDWNQNGSYEPGIDRPYTRVVNTTTDGNSTIGEENVSKTAVVFVPETGEPEPPDTGSNTTTTVTNPANNTTITTTVGPNNTTSTVTTLTVETQEPLTPGTTSSEVPLPLWVPILAVLTVAILLGRAT